MKHVLIRFSLVAVRGRQVVAGPVGFTEYPVSAGEGGKDGPWKECMDWLRYLSERTERPAGAKWDVRVTRRTVDDVELARWLRTR